MKARLTEGASQRVQEDTLKFARIMEGLGTGLLDSIMTLIAFTPILWGLSKQIDVLPWIGEVDHALVWVALITALGGTLILVSTWYQVQLDVKINEWFGEFYDTLQKALTTPNSVTETEFIAYLFTFAKIAGGWIIIAVLTGFFTSHWVFRWRTAMANYYHDQWLKARLTEGASQRVQEDTLKFARIMEGLGTGLLDSLMTLIAFTPILWGLSKQVNVLPWIGEVDHALVWVAILSALGGTLLLAAVGIRLPGIEYDIQKEEAGYRKELVLGEESPIRAAPPTIGQ